MNAIQGNCPGAASLPPTTEARAEGLPDSAWATETAQIATSGRTAATAARRFARMARTVPSSAGWRHQLSSGNGGRLDVRRRPLAAAASRACAAFLDRQPVGEIDGDDR